MKRIGLKLSKDEFAKKKDFKKHYEKNYSNIGVPIDFETEDLWTED